MKIILLCFLILVSCSTPVVKKQGFDQSSIQKYQWGDLEVVYIEDQRLPIYSMAVYFADGALSDGKNKGLTQAAFSYLTLGTRRYSQKDIADNLEFFAVDHGASVTHESVTYSVSGLVKDIQPTVKMICHLFADADFPKKELRSEKKRWRESIKNMVNDQGALASHLFRSLSMRGNDDLAYPVSGKLKDIRAVTRSRLKEKLAYFNNNVKKRIYLSGPRDILSIENVIGKECGWSGKGTFVRSIETKPTSSKNKIVFVTVPQSNQAQVRIGRMLTKEELVPYGMLDFAPGFLGGGFTSRLMRTLRTKEGLVYSVWARASAQKDYGRSFISTATKNAELLKLLNITRGIIDDVTQGDIPDEEFNRSQGLLAGGYPFRFERSDVLLAQLLNLDHQGRPYSELKDYQSRIYGFTKEDLASGVERLFSWDKQTVFILGDKSLLKDLKTFGSVEVLSYKSLL